MGQFYTYKAFDIVFSSEFEIPEFIISEGIPDVQIKIGHVPDNLDQVTKKGVKYQATLNEFLLEVDDIAKYYVKNGNQIIVSLYKEIADKEVRLFLLGSVFGALFLQRSLLPIHGSSIKFGNSACIFSGLSGVGKSSIAAYFVSNGYLFLADDISVINKDLKVVPGFPKLKVWKDILDKLKIKTDSLDEIRPEIKKYHLPTANSFYNKTLPIAKIFIIIPKNTPGFEYEELTGIAKFNAIKNNTFRHRFIEGLEKQTEHFQILNKLLPNIKVYRVFRPQSPILIEEFAEFFINTFQLND